MQAALLLALVLVGLAVPLALAPSAAATHNCGALLNDYCYHPHDLLCLAVIRDLLGLCPYP